MRKKWQPLFAAALILVVFIIMLIPAKEANTIDGEPVYDENLIRYDGWTSFTGEDPRDASLPAYIRPDAEGKVILKNRLPRLIHQGTYLAVYTTDAYLTADAEGEVIYSNASRPDEKPLSRWNYIRLNPENAGKEISLVFTGPDPFQTGMVREVLLGTYGELMMYGNTMVSYDRWVNLAILFIGLLVLLFSLMSFTGRQETVNYFYLGILIALFGIGGICKIAAADRTLHAYYVLLTASRMIHGLQPALYCLYWRNAAKTKKKRQCNALAWGSLFFTAISTAAWSYGPPSLLPVVRNMTCVVYCAVFGFCLYRLLREKEMLRERNRVMLAIGLIILIVSELTGTFTHIGETMVRHIRPETLGALVFILMQTVVALLSAYDHLERQLNLERELNEGKIRLMINQIKPHFINNVMTTIRSMIQYDPDEAEEMVYRFNKYLAYNIDALSSTELCPFALELTHIKTYLNIELTHLRPRLRVFYDIRIDDFEIPPLSVQPFVENAVKHGIAPKMDVGTLTIAAWETADSYMIRIADDGVGFDTTLPYDQRGGHGLGLNNAIQRLQIMVNGSVAIKSSPGDGTEATITIPKLKEEDFDEDDLG